MNPSSGQPWLLHHGCTNFEHKTFLVPQREGRPVRRAAQPPAMLVANATAAPASQAAHGAAARRGRGVAAGPHPDRKTCHGEGWVGYTARADAGFFTHAC